MSWGRITARTDTTVHITVIDLIARPGSTCTGFVSDLAPTDSPHYVEHTCEESFLKMMFPDHRATRELDKITQPLRTVVKRLGVARLAPARQAPFALAVPCGASPTATALHDTLHHTIVYSCKHSLVVKDRHGRVVGEHMLRVVPGSTAPEPNIAASPATTDEEYVVKRNLWVFPRVDRLGSVLTNKAAAFSINVPNADNATAGELLFINMTAFCGIRPRAIKLSIRRTMRCRLNAPATRAALSPFRKALLPSVWADSTSPPTIVSRSTARFNALSTRAHTLPPGITIPSVTAQRSMPNQLRQPSSSSEGALAGETSRPHSLPVVVAASELSDAPSTNPRGSRNGRRSGAETQQTVDFVATVQRVIIGKPFGHSFDGCFYIRIPQTCFSVKTELVDVQHHLTVSLRFGMGRSLKRQVAVHIHQMESGGAGPLHVSTQPPGGWQAAFDLAGGRVSCLTECPICFECMHGSRRSSVESRRASVDPCPDSGVATSAHVDGPPAEAGASTSAAGVSAAAQAEGTPSAVTCDGTCGGSGDGGVSCVSCSRMTSPDGVSEVGEEKAHTGGKVVDAGEGAACVAHGPNGGTLVAPCSDTSSELLASDDVESDMDEAVVGDCSSTESTDAGAARAANHAASLPARVPACMSSPASFGDLLAPESTAAAAATAALDPLVRAGTVPEWLTEDLAVTDCGHVFHSVCLLRHEHAVAARSGTPPASPQCPVCRQVYRRYLGALNAAHS